MNKAKYFLEDHYFLTWYVFLLRENKGDWITCSIKSIRFYFLTAVDFAFTSSSNLNSVELSVAGLSYSNGVIMCTRKKKIQ